MVLCLGGLFYLVAIHNAAHIDYHDSNFFTFWLAGRMNWTGQSPYNTQQWVGNHIHYRANHARFPNRIFPYPLPLSLFLAPLGLFSIDTAYILWDLLSQVILAASVFLFLKRLGGIAQERFFLPLMIALLFFGPVIVTLDNGALGAFFLLILSGSILLFEHKHPVAGGLLLSLLALKPSLGFPILGLYGLWALFRRDWKSLGGTLGGWILLLLTGELMSPLWFRKFMGVDQALLARTLGIQPNVWSIADEVCRQNGHCTLALSGAAMVVLLGAGALYLYHHRQASPWTAFNIMIPLGLMSTLYLWSYDFILLAIPITWIASTLIRRFKSYIPPAIFLLSLDLIAFLALWWESLTHDDAWNFALPVLIFGVLLWLLYTSKRKPARNEPPGQSQAVLPLP